MAGSSKKAPTTNYWRAAAPTPNCSPFRPKATADFSGSRGTAEISRRFDTAGSRPEPYCTPAGAPEQLFNRIIRHSFKTRGVVAPFPVVVIDRLISFVLSGLTQICSL